MTDTYTIGPTGKATIKKDKQATLDYTFNWTLWLALAGSDTISTHTVTVETGLVKVSSSIIDASRRVQAFINSPSGVAGVAYKVTCQIVTAGGRTDERVIYIKLVEDR